MKRITPIITLIFVLMVGSISPSIGLSVQTSSSELSLPSPLPVNMSYRDAILTRCSVRSFNYLEPVEDEVLSTILWAAYVYRDDGNRTVYGIDSLFSIVLYVFREEATYTYNPVNHSLVLFSEGDLRNTVNWQHRAPIQLGLVWNTSINSDENYSSVELGEIGENIYFMAQAFDLGTVTAGLTGFDNIDLPATEIGRTVMPLGYPQNPPVFQYKPKLISLLARLQASTVNLTTVIEQRSEEDVFNGEITRRDLSQLMWASYGFSYYLDTTNSSTNHVERHRTVPSAGCIYPLVIYAVTDVGIFRYFPHILHLNPYSDDPYYSTNWDLPIISFLAPIRLGDYREDIAQASSDSDIASAPLIIISVLPSSSSYPKSWYWYYEAGASAYNVMLEATLLDLHAGIVKPVDFSSIKTALRLDEDSLPLILIPVGM